ncbi:hypothetical protein CONLIGDRAFT_684985 [Coniochaeta ligniaria NRRL 30616]|uniref:RNA helicase n=1 Tax=Coniochaeta ligniaria NRRL 30616 TaxID=1408157 RepID=A0A1J7IVI1_9PEZI|nr:hypothetical protein CONLIGDRAFT_684985 [Coniochaeta ligniaria NRRL 30616]
MRDNDEESALRTPRTTDSARKKTGAGRKMPPRKNIMQEYLKDGFNPANWTKADLHHVLNTWWIETEGHPSPGGSHKQNVGPRACFWGRSKCVAISLKHTHDCLSNSLSPSLSSPQTPDIIRKLEDRATNRFTGNQRAAWYNELLAKRRELPVYGQHGELLEMYHRSQTMIVCAETGSGKTTQVGSMVHYDEYASGLTIACTQPRRLAAANMNYLTALRIVKTLLLAIMLEESAIMRNGTSSHVRTAIQSPVLNGW